MELVPLLDLTCAQLTWMLLGKKDLKEINEILKLPELSPEDMEKAKKEHPWIFEDPPKWDTDDNN
jgi:Skp1 family, dimerisation domain